jgi:Protein of unknown function (DUF4058)
MSSPFPGMDPYLEAPHIWPGFHHKFASELSTELNGLLPAPYYADLEMRPELGIVEQEGERQRIVPDVTVVRHPNLPKGLRGEAVAVLERPRRSISPSMETAMSLSKLRHHFVEIRDPSQGHKLITLIEIVSPSNKRAGSDREAYALKQREVLESDANLIELDFVRAGRRILPLVDLKNTIKTIKPRPAYLVLINRAWRRTSFATRYQIFPVVLRECLPCIPVPLKRGEEEVPLDLQFVFNRAYNTGPYRRGAVDYAKLPAAPRLDPEDAAWAAELTRAWREPAAADPGS